jgi:hypothetical protein
MDSSFRVTLTQLSILHPPPYGSAGDHPAEAVHHLPYEAHSLFPPVALGVFALEFPAKPLENISNVALILGLRWITSQPSATGDRDQVRRESPAGPQKPGPLRHG